MSCYSRTPYKQGGRYDITCCARRTNYYANACSDICCSVLYGRTSHNLPCQYHIMPWDDVPSCDMQRMTSHAMPGNDGMTYQKVTCYAWNVLRHRLLTLCHAHMTCMRRMCRSSAMKFHTVLKYWIVENAEVLTTVQLHAHFSKNKVILM